MGNETDAKEKLRALLTRRNWSDKQASVRAGVSRSTISTYFREPDRDLLFNNMVALARALGVSLDWLAGLPPQPGVSLDWLAGRDRKHQPELTPEQEELVEAYNRLDEAHRSVVLNMVRDLAGK